ncbi:hypothetical protein HDU98_002049 [Podochytrium sp. JEL0797]|nr:hypothetical protein HDU98_002049 [Podochytrium sp. JEL0797]
MEDVQSVLAEMRRSNAGANVDFVNSRLSSNRSYSSAHIPSGKLTPSQKVQSSPLISTPHSQPHTTTPTTTRKRRNSVTSSINSPQTILESSFEALATDTELRTHEKPKPHSPSFPVSANPNPTRPQPRRSSVDSLSRSKAPHSALLSRIVSSHDNLRTHHPTRVILESEFEASMESAELKRNPSYAPPSSRSSTAETEKLEEPPLSQRTKQPAKHAAPRRSDRIVAANSFPNVFEHSSQQPRKILTTSQSRQPTSSKIQSPPHPPSTAPNNTRRKPLTSSSSLRPSKHHPPSSTTSSTSLDIPTRLSNFTHRNKTLHKIAHHIEHTIEEMNLGLSRLHASNAALYPHVGRAEDAVAGMKRISVQSQKKDKKGVQDLKTVEPVVGLTGEMEMVEHGIEYFKYAQESYEESLKRMEGGLVNSLAEKKRPRLTTGATLFGVGQNDDGQLGIYNNEDDDGIPCTNQFKLVTFKHLSDLTPSIVKIACGGMHALALTSTGKILSWGAADFIGRFTKTLNWQPQPIELPDPPLEFIDVVCGECFSSALDQSGRIWAWGSFRDTTGSEHFTKTTPRQHSPTLLHPPPKSKVVNIAAGESHFIALCLNGTVFGWGINSHGQLGRPSQGDSRNDICAGIPLVLPAGFSATSVYACGFSTFVTGRSVDGTTRLLACGGNGFGELGLGHESACWFLREVSCLKNKPILDIKGGLHHSVVLTADGTVFVAGRGDSGQLGLGSSIEHSNVFLQLETLEKCDAIACSTSGNQTYVTTVSGQLFAMGYNCYGQLGLKHEENEVVVPSLVPLKSRKALLVAGGSQFLIVGASERLE